MKYTIRKKMIRRTHILKRILPLAAMAAAIIGFVLPVMAAPPLPREPMPKPRLPGIFQGVPKPPVHIGTRPKFNPSNIGALPDLKIVRVTPRIHSRVAGICRSGRKDRPGGSIPVLNFDLVVKNVGRGTAYMGRYGVILSARTMDFRERVFDTNKRYQGGTGGPRPWSHIRMAPIAPGATFVAHTRLGIGRNNTTFPISRMPELAGQTHRFRIKLTSYGSPGLKESNTRNNTYIVRYTFPRNFCQPAGGIHVRPVGVPVSTLPSLPDLTIVRVTPRLIPQAASACQSGGSYRGGLIHLETVIKNVGRGSADYRRYQYGIRITTTDPLSRRTPRFFIRKIYPTGPRSGAPGQSVTNQNDLDATGIYSGIFPPGRYHELAGKTRHFKVEIVDGPGAFPHPMLESNYRNNTKTFSFTFPRNFCQQNTLHGGVSQAAPTLKPHLVIQSIRTQLRRPYECRAAVDVHGRIIADVDLVIKNTGAVDFIPQGGRTANNLAFFGGGSFGHKVVTLEMFAYFRSRIPAGATRHVRAAMRAAGNPNTTPLSVMAGFTPSFDLRQTSLRNYFYDNHDLYIPHLFSIHFPSDFCTSRVHGGISSPIGDNQIVKPNITGFQFAGGKSCVSPGGVFNIKGSSFGNSAAGRTIALGGNGVGFNLAIKSWNNRTIRVQLPRTARLQYRKNYWVRIKAPAVAGSARTLSNLKRGVVLCPPTVRVGGSGSSGNQSAGRQNGGRGFNVATGLPDLTISRLVIGNPSPACFAYSYGAGNKKFYTLASMPTTITLKNIGPVAYSTRDRSRNKQLPIGIIGDHFVGRPDRHGYSLCAEPESQNRFSNLNIPAGGSKTIRTQLTIELCKGSKHIRVFRLPGALVNTLLGRSRSTEIGIGKAVFIKNKIPVESNYNNNSRRTSFTFPDRICGSR